ncbi:MAG: hypothetical protein ACLFUB_16485 [Cyclobacteriaceae bacterium]
MDIKDKIRQSLYTLSEQDLQKVEQLVTELKSKKGRRTRHLNTRDLGGKFDHINIRDAAYE